MGLAVCSGAMMQCSFGVAPSTLIVLPENRTMVSNQPMATIMAAATAAKLGVFTPAACVPSTAAPWVPGSPTVLVGNKPALNNNSKLMCMWGGIIQVLNPGQFQAQVP
jgi:hypothetical protein